jgi:Mg2+/Co2+ transporter CorC
MNKAKFWCITWNPFSRQISRERLDVYEDANQQDFLDADDQSRVEVLLEISDSETEIDERVKYWYSIQQEPPPLQSFMPEQ